MGRDSRNILSQILELFVTWQWHFIPSKCQGCWQLNPFFKEQMTLKVYDWSRKNYKLTWTPSNFVKASESSNFIYKRYCKFWPRCHMFGEQECLLTSDWQRWSWNRHRPCAPSPSSWLLRHLKTRLLLMTNINNSNWAVLKMLGAWGKLRWGALK